MKPALRIPREHNPHYPLPSDYAELTEGGQREARVNACRQWTLPTGSPEERAENRVASLHFFDAYYLRPDHEMGFDPGFYDEEPLPTPGFHWDLIRLWAMHRLTVALAPRGGAKSSLTRKDMALCLLTAPNYSFVYATSTHDNARLTGTLVRDICYQNPRVVADFPASWGVDRMRPARGMKDTATEHFYLTNNSWLRCVSVNTRVRGLRPKRFRLDDPEYDAKASTSMEVLRDGTEQLVFKLALPMVLRSECGLDWTGTFVSKRHLLWHAMLTTEGPQGVTASDARFNFWARLLIRACHEDEETGKLVSCWPERWPSDNEERIRMNRPGELTLPEIRELMGVQAFNGEMLGRPGESSDQFFKFDPSSFGRHAYWYENVDPNLATNPWESSALICWRDKDLDFVRTPLPEFLASAKLFIAVDTAYTEKSTSDRRVANLMALAPGNLLFCLDLWSDRKPDAVLQEQTFKMAEKWRCPAIFVEVVKESYKLYERFNSSVRTRFTESLDIKHIPKVLPLKPGHLDKQSKISTLDIRFEHGLIKLPVYARSSAPWWSRLFEQIEGFNPTEEKGGGLQHDDELDTCSMSSLIIKGRLRKQAPTTAPSSFDANEALRKGETHMPNGGPALLHGAPLSFFDPELIARKLSTNPDPDLVSTRDSRI